MAYTKQNFVDQQVLTAGHLNHIEDGIANILDTVYPVGSIYMSSNSTSPASLFGGTWEQLKDRFLLGAGNSYAVNATGGEATHTLTVNEMPSHNHVYNGWAMSADNVASAAYVLAKPYDGKNNFGDTVQNTGGSAAHNNMPPYLAVYMWKRIA